MKSRRWAGAVAAVSVVVSLATAALSPARPAAAQTDQDKARIDSQIATLRRQVGEASATEAQLLRAIDASSARQRELDAKVATLDAEMSGVQRDLDGAQGRLSALKAEETSTVARLVDAGRQLDASRATLVHQAIAAYTGQSEAARFAGMLLTSKSVGQLASKRSYLRAAAGTQGDVIATDQRLRDEVGDLREQLAAGRRQAQSTRDAVAAQEARLSAARVTQAGLRAQVGEELAQDKRLRQQVVARRQQYESEVSDLQKESAAIAEALRNRTPLGGSKPGRLLMPTPGAPITSGFGPRIHPIYGTARMHNGIDLGAPMGAPIRAAAAGVVVSSGPNGGYGIATIIDHGGGLATLYAHQSSTGVKAGQRVATGQVIGRVGSTGDSTGPHLHFEVRANGEPVNPRSYL